MNIAASSCDIGPEDRRQLLWLKEQDQEKKIGRGMKIDQKITRTRNMFTLVLQIVIVRFAFGSDDSLLCVSPCCRLHLSKTKSP